MTDNRTPLTLDDALHDVGALRQVGEGAIRMAMATVAHLPDSREPLAIYAVPWPTEAERVAAVGPEPDADDPFRAGEHAAWAEAVAAARAWSPPEGEAHNIYAVFDPAFAAFLNAIPDREPQNTGRRATLRRSSTARLRARYWEGTDALAAAATARPAMEAAGEPYAALRGAADDPETERRLILEELARRGDGLVPIGGGS